MKIHHNFDTFHAHNPIVTIGMFDGVHAGHRSILAQLQHLKKLHNGESVLITFDPHPQMLFRTNPNFGILTTMDEKLGLLAKTGLDHCIIVPFTQEFSQLSGEEYIETILYKGAQAHTVVIGYDHNYGKNASGNFALMQKMGVKYNFAVEEIPAFDLYEMHVSSTKIRKALYEGNVEQAREFLTYPYSLSGTVVQGKQIGRTIGFPTANIAIENTLKIIPAIGVYAARVEIANQHCNAVVNIGTNPTIAAGLAQTIEVHILDFNTDIYGKNLRVHFEKRLRGQQKFASLGELQRTIQYDIENAKKFV
ncbi:MAG: bifunctional riboflavin kinase/FAD synthetase [Bacteroidetes bacterium]|nr:bifunctional riboflavin kinase/FAD synthetase [Bacteroidota bacterium]